MTFGNRISVRNSLKSHLNHLVKNPGKNPLRNPKRSSQNSLELTPVRNTGGKAILIEHNWEHDQQPAWESNG